MNIWDYMVCLSFSKIRITDDLRNYLFLTTQEMFESGDKEVRFSTEYGEGEITTTFKRTLLGGFGGYEFTATVDTEKGSGEVVFIAKKVSNFNIEHSSWMLMPANPYYSMN